LLVAWLVAIVVHIAAYSLKNKEKEKRKFNSFHFLSIPESKKRHQKSKSTIVASRI
jgi:hypothetical protein